MRRALAVIAVALAVPAAAVAGDERPTLDELEAELMCPACDTTLEQSNSPIANEMRRFIRARIAAGDSESEIKRKLAAQFGDAILAAPPREGFGLLAWVLPLAAIAVAGAALAVGAWKWSRLRRDGDDAGASDGPRLAPEAERLVDDAVARFDG